MMAEMAEEFTFIDYDVADGVCVLTLNRPDALNALNGELLLELALAV